MALLLSLLVEQTRVFLVSGLINSLSAAQNEQRRDKFFISR